MALAWGGWELFPLKNLCSRAPQPCLAPETGFLEDNFSTDRCWGGGGFRWFKRIAFIVLLISILTHQLHLRSSGIRARRLGTPGVECPPALTDSFLGYKCELFSFPPPFRSHGIGNSPTHPQKEAKDYCRVKHLKDILFESIHVILIIMRR